MFEKIIDVKKHEQKLSTVARLNYADRIITAVNELDRLFDESGKVDTAAGMAVIHELRKAFNYSELAGYTVNLFEARQDQSAYCVHCWGAENYLSVEPGRSVPITDVKKLLVLYMIGYITGDFSKLDEVMPNWREYMARGYFSVVKNDRAEVIMFRINDWEKLCDDSPLGKELAFQLNQDASVNYPQINREYLKQLAFFVLSYDTDTFHTGMARNVIDSAMQDVLLPLAPTDEKDFLFFKKALEIIIDRYQKKLNDINNYEMIGKLNSLIDHDVKIPIITVSSYAVFLQKKVNEAKQKEGRSENDYVAELDAFKKLIDRIAFNSQRVEKLIPSVVELFKSVLKGEILKTNLFPSLLRLSDVFKMQCLEFGIELYQNISFYENDPGKFMLSFDQNIFESLINNVFENAKKYIRKGIIDDFFIGKDFPAISIDTRIEKNTSFYAGPEDYTVYLDIANDGQIVEQSILDEKVKLIRKGERLEPDQSILIEKYTAEGLQSNGRILTVIVPMLLGIGAGFDMQARAEGGVTVKLSFPVKKQD